MRNDADHMMRRLMCIAVIACFALVTVMEPVLAAGQGSGDDRDYEVEADSWRYQDGYIVEQEDSSVSTYSLRSSEPSPKGAYRKGMDVSHHQGKIDWNTVKKSSDIDFVIIRCGYGNDRTSQDDREFRRNISECERLKIPYGVYIYSYAENSSDVTSEVNHTLRLLKGHRPEYPVYYDLEDKTVKSAGKTNIRNFAVSWCSRIEAAGYEAGIYANLDWWNNILNDSRLDRYDRWVAQWGSSCTYRGDYRLWQYTSKGRVAGIGGNVDLNYDYRKPVPPEERLGSVVLEGDSYRATNGGFKYQYTGEAVSPDPVVKSSSGAVLKKDQDYTLSHSTIKEVGEYKVTVKGQGKYSGQTISTKVIVVPVWPKSVKVRFGARNGGYDDVYTTWTKVPGADGYRVYYRKPSKTRWYTLGYTTKCSYMKRDLKDGTKYQFRVLPYYYSNSAKGRYYAFHSKFSPEIYTLKRISTPVIYKASSTRVKVKWKNIPGEGGYQISRSTSRNGTNIVSTYSTTKGNYRILKPVKYRTYYYKVRAYKNVVAVTGKTFRVCGPWSAPKAYRLR